MFCAFALEAYLNHLGAIRFPKALWKGLESKLSPETKLDLIAKEMGFTSNKGERPFQTFGDIIAFRNALAHGKTHKASEPVFLDDAEPAKYEKPWWMTFCTLEKAEQCRKDTRAMIFALHKAAGIGTVALGSYGASVPMRWKR